MILRRGVWDLPKGHRDQGETLEQCAAREVCEECGLLPEWLTVGDFLCETVHQSAPCEEKHTSWFRMEYLGSPGDVRPQVEEDIVDVRWFTIDEAREAAAESYESIRQIMKLL